ncbi:MAG: calcium-binding protein, partial [Gemmatimonas sp.]
TLTGNDVANVLDGNAGNDVLTGAGGNDTLIGNGGNDTMAGGAGNDLLNGGANTDTVTYAADADAMFIDLAAGTARRGSAANPVEDTLVNVENAIGGGGNDTITSNGGVNRLSGGSGNDLLSSGGGADSLVGGGGDDTMIGGAGDDFFVFTDNFGSDTINDFDANPAGGQDRLDVREYSDAVLGTLTAGNFAARVVISDLGNDTRVTIDGTDTLLLVGVNGVGTNTITIQDFIL